VFGIVVEVVFQTIFYLKIYQIIFYIFFKFIFDTSTLKQSKNIKKFKIKQNFKNLKYITGLQKQSVPNPIPSTQIENNLNGTCECVDIISYN
jgi:hypothetical protein